MAVNPKLIYEAARILSNEKVRKFLLCVVFFALGFVMLIAVVFSGLVSGLLSILQTNDLKNHWTYVRSCLSEAMGGLETTINNDVKDEVYDFMPDFSVNLSKAAFGESFGNSLIAYDSSEVEIAEKEMITYAEQLRSIGSAAELSEYLLAYGGAGFSFSEISDSVFKSDTGITKMANYKDGVKQFLYARAMEQMPHYEYTYDKGSENGRSYTLQTLNVRSADGKVQTVEYKCYGGGSLYLPHFLALYSAYQTRELIVEINDRQKAESVDKLIEETVGGIPETEDAANSYIQGVWDNIVDGKGSIKLNVFETANLKSLLNKSVTSGSMGISTKRTANKLTVTLESPAEETWVKIFDLNDGFEDYIDETEKAIETALKEAGIPETEWVLSVDNAVQAALFVYFEGFFELPVSSSDLASGTNGILTGYGELSAIHQYEYASQIYNVPEEGMKLSLANGKTPIHANLLNNSKCVYDAVIYDVWDMEHGSHPVEKTIESRVFNYSAVTIAYMIDTKQFKREYGFPFPSIDGVKSTGTITLFLEFTCLDSITVSELDIGTSIYDELDQDFIIGYSHSGNYSSERDGGIWTHRIFKDDCIPHAGIKVFFKSGDTSVSRPEGVHTYGGPSAQKIGVSANPRLWFKGFRSNMSDELLATLTAGKP